jgi:hypothetical protein
MKIIRLFVIIVAYLLFINWSCSKPDPDYLINLNVPYHAQQCPNWCGVACVQMWSDFDGPLVSQQDIADSLGIGGGTASPWELEQAVAAYTASEGYVALKDWLAPGAQGDLIGATICGIDAGIPSIMPFDQDHAVLIKGHKWSDSTGRPIAKKTFFHDPDNDPDREITGSGLVSRFDPCPFQYWVLIGYEDFLLDGIDGHIGFILRGGAYYGGPDPYDPKGILPPLPVN